MLAVDTNIVVRYLLEGDDQAQFVRSVAVIESGAEIFVAKTVVLETDWVLRSVYGFAPAQVASALEGFGRLPGIIVEDVSQVTEALACMRRGLDLADALHVVSSSQCEAFVTFDKALARAAADVTMPRVQLA